MARIAPSTMRAATMRATTTRAAGTARLPGFTLTELLVMAVVLLIVLGTIGQLSNQAARFQQQGTTGQRRADLIASDVAEILRINRRYTCVGLASAAASCPISADDPGQDGYYPSGAGAALTHFQNRCDGSGSLSFAQDVVNQIPGASRISSDLSAAGVSRTLAVETASGGRRYSVTYNDVDPGGRSRVLRVLSLEPATVAWCP